MDESDDGRLRNDTEEDGNVRRMRKMKALSVKAETLTLIGKFHKFILSAVILDPHK